MFFGQKTAQLMNSHSVCFFIRLHIKFDKNILSGFRISERPFLLTLICGKTFFLMQFQKNFTAPVFSANPMQT